MATTMTRAGRWWALGGVALAVLAVGMDLTVLSVALPTLASALRASESDLQWFSSGYALVLAAAMLPAGLLGDRYGRKKVMLFSLALFAAGSLACAYSRTPAQFIAARALLGLAGAGIIVMAMSALAVLFSSCLIAVAPSFPLKEGAHKTRDASISCQGVSGMGCAAARVR